MRQDKSTTYDRATAIVHAVNDAEIVIADTIRAGIAERFGRPVEERAHQITQALDAAGFEVRYRPLDIQPDEAAVAEALTSSIPTARSVIADLDDAGYQIVPKPPGRGWRDLLAQQEAERRRAYELGLTPPARSAILVSEHRTRMAFEDIDRPPPAAAGHADYLLATWVRALGDAVDWCEMRLLPRRLVLNASLCGRVPSDEQLRDLDERLGIIRALRGVVGADRTLHGSPGVTVQVRFDYYITTIGCEYTPLDLPARPVRRAA